MENINQEIENFINSISHLWVKEPLDGDGTQEIADAVLNELDYINGNE